MAEGTQKVDIDYMTSKMEARYQDEDVVVFDSIPTLPDNQVYKINLLTFYGFTKGRMQFDLNGKTYNAAQGDLVICLPNSYIDNYMMSPDLKIGVIGISYTVLQRHLNISKNYWNIIRYISENPVLHLDGQQLQLLGYYNNIFRYKQSNPTEYFHRETIQTLLRCMFLEIASIIMPMIKSAPEKGILRHGEQLFKRFLELLSENDGRERSVKSYAEQLCITPKYLSTLSKTASGKSALAWIHHFAADAIERRLRYSDKTIKEISDEMNFPNLSFFGKFTKAHLGKSPTEYRRTLDNV